MLNESAIRREGWISDLAVRLSDGQVWSFPRPVIRTSLGRDESGKLILKRSCVSEDGYGEVLDESRVALKALMSADDASLMDAQSAFLITQFNLAVLLLRRNYEVSEADAMDLLAFDVGDDDAAAVHRRIYDLAAGNSQKKASESGG